MTNESPVPGRPERGFSLVEMLIVVLIVAVMAAVALPNIGQYIRNYRIKGAATQVAGEMQTARAKAIMTNANAGVSFVAVDADSYRFVQEDLLVDVAAGSVPDGTQFSPSWTCRSACASSWREAPTPRPWSASTAWAGTATRQRAARACRPSPPPARPPSRLDVTGRTGRTSSVRTP